MENHIQTAIGLQKAGPSLLWMRHKYIVVEGRPLDSSRLSSRAICAKHRNEKRKNAGAEEPAMYSAIYKMQLFYPQFRGISASHGWRHEHRHFTLNVSQLIIKYPLGQKSIPLSLLVSYFYHHGSEFFFLPLNGDK